MDIITQTVLTTTEQMIPALLQAAGTAANVSNPAAASAIALAPVAMQLLNSAMQIQAAGAMTPEQLATLFATIGTNIKTAHDAWTAGIQPTTA